MSTGTGPLPRPGEWIPAAPEGGGPATRALDLDDRSYDFALVVDPAQAWVLLPAARGARVVDLATGESRTVDVGCPSAQPVLDLVPGRGGAAALLLGGCDAGAGRTPMLWIAGT